MPDIRYTLLSFPIPRSPLPSPTLHRRFREWGRRAKGKFNRKMRNIRSSHWRCSEGSGATQRYAASESIPSPLCPHHPLRATLFASFLTSSAAAAAATAGSDVSEIMFFDAVALIAIDPGHRECPPPRGEPQSAGASNIGKTYRCIARSRFRRSVALRAGLVAPLFRFTPV